MVEHNPDWSVCLFARSEKRFLINAFCVSDSASGQSLLPDLGSVMNVTRWRGYFVVKLRFISTKRVFSQANWWTICTFALTPWLKSMSRMPTLMLSACYEWNNTIFPGKIMSEKSIECDHLLLPYSHHEVLRKSQITCFRLSLDTGNMCRNERLCSWLCLQHILFSSKALFSIGMLHS